MLRTNSVIDCMCNERAWRFSACLTLRFTQIGSRPRPTCGRCRMTLRLCVLTRISLFATRLIVFRDRKGGTKLIILSMGSMCVAICRVVGGLTPRRTSPGGALPGSRLPDSVEAVAGYRRLFRDGRNPRLNCRSAPIPISPVLQRTSVAPRRRRNRIDCCISLELLSVCCILPVGRGRRLCDVRRLRGTL